MRKEKIELIKKYFQNYPDFEQQRLLLREIALETSAVEKKEIFDFCKQEIKKLRFYFLVRIPLMVLLINLCLSFLGIFKFKITLIYAVLLMSLGLYILLVKDGMGLSMPTIAINFFLGKKNIYL
ncbi:MAG: hypothetical protein QNJ54_34195 [Prochloraceae cyanobacterium]|nr:hypothetical protein [Prochloraceae cyanobacterium]